MIARVKVGPNKRLLVESGINQYKIVGPGWVWLIAGQRLLTTLYVGPQDKSFTFNKVQTVENIPLDVTVQALFQIAPNLFADKLLPNLPGLNEGGWQHVLKWQMEEVLRHLLADYAWQELVVCQGSYS